MLRVGLSGGIGSGKSTVSARLRERGAVLIDADVLAREVVAPGSAGLAAIRETFGDRVIAPDGSLDRPALGAVVFADPEARAALEAITHPLVHARTRQLMAQAPRDAVVVHDIPLLVELQRSADYHLTVIVGSSEETRLQRLVQARGMTLAAAAARIRAQADDEQRRSAADVWLDNEGTLDELLRGVDALWDSRIEPFNDNLLAGRSTQRASPPVLMPYDVCWPAEAARVGERVARALGERCQRVDHVGSTSVPGLAAEDVIDLQVTVASLSDADEHAFLKSLAEQGFPRCGDQDQGETPAWAPDPSAWRGRLHASSDPGRVARLYVREHGSEGWRSALLLRDWLRAHDDERAAYDLEQNRCFGEATATLGSVTGMAAWVAAALARARAWADTSDWLPKRAADGASGDYAPARERSHSSTTWNRESVGSLRRPDRSSGTRGAAPASQWPTLG